MMRIVGAGVAGMALVLVGCSASSTPDKTTQVNDACASALTSSMTKQGLDAAKPQEKSIKVSIAPSGGWIVTGKVFAMRSNQSDDKPAHGLFMNYECRAKDVNGTITAEADLKLSGPR